MKAFYDFIKKYWYLSPVEVIKFLTQELREERLFFKNLSDREKSDLKKRNRRQNISLIISIALHSIFFLAIFNGFFIDPDSMDADLVSDKNIIDFELLEGMVSAEMDSVYDENSDIIIKDSFLIKKKEIADKRLSLDNLLKELKALKVEKSTSSVASYKSNIHKETNDLKAGFDIIRKHRKLKPLKIQFWDQVKLSPKEGVSRDLDYSNIMQVIDQHSVSFRDCYERALLKDDKLSVKAVFLLDIANSKVKKTKLELEGQGKPSSRRQLSHCLFRESKKLLFVQNKKPISIKFNLIFGL